MMLKNIEGIAILGKKILQQTKRRGSEPSMTKAKKVAAAVFMGEYSRAELQFYY